MNIFLLTGYIVWGILGGILLLFLLWKRALNKTYPESTYSSIAFFYHWRKSINAKYGTIHNPRGHWLGVRNWKVYPANSKCCWVGVEEAYPTEDSHESS